VFDFNILVPFDPHYHPIAPASPPVLSPDYTRNKGQEVDQRKARDLAKKIKI